MEEDGKNLLQGTQVPLDLFLLELLTIWTLKEGGQTVPKNCVSITPAKNSLGLCYDVDLHENIAQH